MKTSKKLFALLITLFLAVSLLAFQRPGNDKYFEILKNLDIFATLYKEVNNNYVDDLNPNALMKVGIESMLETLDPYTVYYSEDEIEDARTENTGEYGGIGAVIGEKDGGRVMVILPDKDSPAERAGLQRGDEILMVNGVKVEGDYERAASQLRGQANSVIELMVKSPNGASRTVEVQLDKITVPSVPYSELLEGDIAYIKLTGFTATASSEVRSALRDLKKQGANRVMLDLRDNGGGLLSEAVNVSNLFIPKNELVVTTKGKLEEMNSSYKTPRTSFDEDIPVAILINEKSASASEIVAGVMQDYDRGILVGRKSFGKGLVQRTMPLSYNTQLKVTIAKYYIPSNRSIQAIDYTNRNPDGSVGKISDALKTAFKTKGGRTVYDGGGIDPDFLVEEEELSPFTQALLKEDMFFLFGNDYLEEVQTIKEVKNFLLEEVWLRTFEQWLRQKNFKYETEVTDELKTIASWAEREGQSASLKNLLSELEKELNQELPELVAKHKDELLNQLTLEFVTRQHLNIGQIKRALHEDKEVQKAMEILGDEKRYQEALRPKQ